MKKFSILLLCCLLVVGCQSFVSARSTADDCSAEVTLLPSNSKKK